jgi:Cu(I)/Ag(I) efflux system membrane fusion protein
MTSSPFDDDPELAGNEALPKEPLRHGVRWWLRVIEVRLRFVVLVLVVLIVVTQWQRLRGAWDDWWFAWHRPPAASGVPGEIEYFCPMDPGVVSIWPAICPICNMDLVQRKKHDAQLLPEGVVARMQITPYRVQLAGIRTAEVQARDLVYEVPVSGVLNSIAPDSEAAAQSNELTFEAAVTRDDALLLSRKRAVTVSAADNSAAEFAGVAEIVSPNSEQMSDGDRAVPVPHVRIRISSTTGLTAGTPVRAVIRVPVTEVMSEPPSDSADQKVAGRVPLAVPESAVVDHGDLQLVFVESMPGTFDAVAVKLGPRCGDAYPVLQGLEPQQRVAVTGAFLIDAETRLNPSLAVAYFGANQASAEGGRPPEVRMATKSDSADNPTLSPEDAALAERQRVCPVTGQRLNSMGGPLLVVVEGRKVFLCCKGCERPLKNDPAKYLAKLPAQ